MKHRHESDATQVGDASPVHTIIEQAQHNADTLNRLAGMPGEPGCVGGCDCPAAPIHSEMAKAIALLTMMIAPIYKAFYNGGLPSKAAPRKAALEFTEWVTRFGTFRIPQALVSLIFTWAFRALILLLLWPSDDERAAARLREMLMKSVPQVSASDTNDEAIRRLQAALMEPEAHGGSRNNKGGKSE